MTDSSQIMAAYGKVSGDSKKLFERNYPDQKAVVEAGNLAFECGSVCRTLSELEEFKSVLDGRIRWSNAQQQTGEWHHLWNKLAEGFASSGHIKTEEDLLGCSSLLVEDPGKWVVKAETVLIKVCVPILRSLDSAVEFCSALKSPRALEILRTAHQLALANNAAVPKPATKTS